MRIKLRLKGIQDADLLTLYQIRTFSLKTAIYEVLAAYVRGYQKVIDIPDCSLVDVPLEPVQIYINMDEAADADIISFCDGITAGARSAVIKQILRNCLSRPCIDAMIKGGGSLSPKKAEIKPVNGNNYAGTSKTDKAIVNQPGSFTTISKDDQEQLSGLPNKDKTNKASDAHTRKIMIAPIEEDAEDNNEPFDLFSDSGFVENY